MTEATADGLPDATRIGRVELTVSELEETTAFYRDVVGLEVLERGDGATPDGDGATLGVDGTPLVVLRADAAAPARRPREAGLFHTAFRVPTRAALGDALDRIRSRWRLDGASDHRVSEALYLSDPEGNGVEVYRDLPRESWPMTDDGGVAMGTDPLDLDSVAAAATGTDGAPSETDVGHVHLEVSSLAAAEAVYVDALGFEEMAAYPGAKFLAAGGYHHHVGVNTWNRRTEPARRRSRGLAWFEVCVPTTNDVEAVRERLTAADVDVAALGTGEGFEARDADGIGVRVRAEG